MSEDFADRVHEREELNGASAPLSRLYREIGLAAIAAELEIPLGDIGAPHEKVSEFNRRELAA